MTASSIWYPPGAYYLLFGVNSGGDKLQVPRKPCQAAIRLPEPPELPGSVLSQMRPSGLEPSGALCQAGLCEHSRRGQSGS